MIHTLWIVNCKKFQRLKIYPSPFISWIVGLKNCPQLSWRIKLWREKKGLLHGRLVSQSGRQDNGMSLSKKLQKLHTCQNVVKVWTSQQSEEKVTLLNCCVDWSLMWTWLSSTYKKQNFLQWGLWFCFRTSRTLDSSLGVNSMDTLQHIKVVKIVKLSESGEALIRLWRN